MGRMTLGDEDNGDQGPQRADLPSLEGGDGAMSHRFAIIPAGSVDSVDQENDLIYAIGAGIDLSEAA